MVAVDAEHDQLAPLPPSVPLASAGFWVVRRCCARHHGEDFARVDVCRTVKTGGASLVGTGPARGSLPPRCIVVNRDAAETLMRNSGAPSRLPQGVPHKGPRDVCAEASAGQ